MAQRAKSGALQRFHVEDLELLIRAAEVWAKRAQTRENGLDPGIHKFRVPSAAQRAREVIRAARKRDAHHAIAQDVDLVLDVTLDPDNRAVGTPGVGPAMHRERRQRDVTARVLGAAKEG